MLTVHMRSGRTRRTDDQPVLRRHVLCEDGMIRGEHGVLVPNGGVHRLVVGYIVSGEFYQRGAFCRERHATL